MSKEATAWMPFYIGDYLGDTQRLTTEQHGAYLLLILDYWRNGPAPDDDAVLQQITKLDRVGWKRCRPALARLFKIAEGEWRHKRIEHELAEAKKNAERRSSKARAAAQARWGESSGDATSNATSMPGALLGECPPQSPSPEANASPRAGAREADFSMTEFTADLCRDAGVALPDQGAAERNRLTIEEWIEAGADRALIREVILARVPNLRTSPRLIAFFDKPIRDAVEQRKSDASQIDATTDAIMNRVLGRSAA